MHIVFISERSEFELTGNGYAGTALQNGCGLERMSGGERQQAAAMPKSGKTMSDIISGLQRTKILSGMDRS